MTTTTTTRLMRDSFDRFGDDLANLLLAYLMITPEDKLKLQLVSKQWQSVLFGVQTDLTIDIDRRHYKQRVKLFAMILQKCPNITGVVITHRSDCSIDELVDLLMTYCPHLLHLRLHILHHECHLNWDTFDRLLSSFGPQLQTLELTTVFSINNKLLVRKVSDFVPQLKKLMIGYSMYPSLDFSHYFSQQGVCLLPKNTSLQSLSFQLTDHSNWQSLIGPFAKTHGHQLTTVDIGINFREETNLPIFVEALTQMSLSPNLRRLSLTIQRTLDPFVDYSDNLIDELIRQQFSRRYCYQLKSLNIEVKRITNSLLFYNFLDSLGKSCRQLKRLTISFRNEDNINNSNTDNNWLIMSESMKQMKQLTHLSLNLGIGFIGDKFFIDIADYLPRLQVIDIKYADISRRSLQSLSRLSHLTNLRFANCRSAAVLFHCIFNDLIKRQPNVAKVFISWDSNGQQFMFGFYNDCDTNYSPKHPKCLIQ